MGNKARGCGRDIARRFTLCYIWLKTTTSCFIICSARPNVVLSTDLMYEFGVSMGKKGSDLSITMPQNTTKSERTRLRDG